MLRNDFATFEVNMAAGQLGAYAVPINWHLTAEEAGYILADSRAKVLVIHADLLAQIASGIPIDTKVLVVPTPPEIGDAYGVPAKCRSASSAETWDRCRERGQSRAAQALARQHDLHPRARPDGRRACAACPRRPNGRPNGLSRSAGTLAWCPTARSW
jgi:acyl-CoA synthetase (AMP-forming)/AMP-acid ligase II